MALEPDPIEKREQLEKPPMPPQRPAQSPWYALIAVLIVGLVAWWFIDGPATDPSMTSSISAGPAAGTTAPADVGEASDDAQHVLPAPDSQ